MKIEYKYTKELSATELQRMFLSVNCESGNYSEKLVRAMQNSFHVVSAWDDNKLVGLVRALNDDETVVFLHYLLHDPTYQGQHIGYELMRQLMCFYQNLLYMKVISSVPKTLEEKDVSKYQNSLKIIVIYNKMK